MLVLSRKAGEAIAIDGGIKVKVISVHGRTVKIGIEAPDSVSITRMELLLDAEVSCVPDRESEETTLATLTTVRDKSQRWPRGSNRSGGSMRTAMIPR